MTTILIMGLSGSGKTTLALELLKYIDATYINADTVRAEANDWDFSIEGRIRQANRMRVLSSEADSPYVIADFICPTEQARIDFNPNYIIWVNTVTSSQYADTDMIFQKPKNADFIVTTKDSKFWVPLIARGMLALESEVVG
jgi:adenylylsulfate kinase